MRESLRFFRRHEEVIGDVVLDLAEVDYIVITGSSLPNENCYNIALKSGAVVTFRGSGLISQFEKYKGVPNE